jgi:hypothetical protein
MSHRFAAAPIAEPQGPQAITSELGAMADAMEEHVPFTAQTLAARLLDDPQARQLAAIAALALALRELTPSDAAALDRVLAEGPRPKRRKRE